MLERPAVIEATAVTYAVGAVRLVDGIDLAVRSGELVGVLGPNGAGKSTLLRLLSGELSPASGGISLDGADMRRMSPALLASRRAVVPQSTALAFPFTAREVVLLGASVPGMGLDVAHWRDAASEALDAVGMTPLAARLYLELSGGERQRVHVARALCQLAAARRPPGAAPILLLDEPTSSLDLAHQRLVLGAVRRVAEDGAAVLAVLHDLNLAAAYCDRLVLLSDGRVAAHGAPRSVIESRTLSAVFGCDLTTDATPSDGTPFVLPVLSRAQRGASAPHSSPALCNGEHRS